MLFSTPQASSFHEMRLNLLTRFETSWTSPAADLDGSLPKASSPNMHLNVDRVLIALLSRETGDVRIPS